MKNLQRIWGKVKEHALRQEKGIDGILVTVGLCIIALLLCVVMKDSLTTFIQTIVTAMQTVTPGRRQGESFFRNIPKKSKKTIAIRA